MFLCGRSHGTGRQAFLVHFPIEKTGLYGSRHDVVVGFCVASLETYLHRTSYDPVRKQHWLSVYRQNLAVRFLLKDHGHATRKANHDSRQTESLILNAVDQMVAAINQADQNSRP